MLAKLVALGVETSDDLALLSAGDLVPPELPFEVRATLEREFPLTVNAGDAVYEATYDLERGQVTLRTTKGGGSTLPPLSYLPRFEGLRICIDGPRGIAILRR